MSIRVGRQTDFVVGLRHALRNRLAAWRHTGDTPRAPGPAEGEEGSVSTRERSIILVFRATYLPGFKGGGPTRSIANLVEHLGDEYDFRIVTSDRDKGDAEPYQGTPSQRWVPVGKALVWYRGPDDTGLRSLRGLMSDTHYDVLYLNSFFNVLYTLWPLLASRATKPGVPIVIAPRGEFSLGALALKRWRKRSYVSLARIFDVFRDAVWQASSEGERRDILATMGPDRLVMIAPNLPATSSTDTSAHSSTVLGPVRVLFLSRIVPMKNLAFALQVLGDVSVPVDFTIVGPREDDAYWLRCAGIAERLPRHIRVTVQPEIEPGRVPGEMARHDLFFLPTRGENYGHVIAEALSAGTPVLISDQTPWRELTRDCLGWDLPLDVPDAFARAIESVAAMPPEARSEWRARIMDRAARRLSTADSIELTRQLFRKALSLRDHRK